MGNIEYDDTDDLPPSQQSMQRRLRPDDEADGQPKTDRDAERSHDTVKPSGRRKTGLSRRVDRHRRPRNRHDPSGPPR